MATTAATLADTSVSERFTGDCRLFMEDLAKDQAASAVASKFAAIDVGPLLAVDAGGRKAAPATTLPC